MTRPKDVTPAEAETFMQNRTSDSYTLLDVRQDWEYAEGHVPGARLLPLPELPDKLADLPRDRPVLAYCRSGRRSAAAAGLLAGQGYEVMNILGGFSAWQGAAAEGPADQGLARLPEAASLLDVLSLAYAMEANLGVFYAACAARAADPEQRRIFLGLARFEEGHKAMVLHLARGLGLGETGLTARAEGIGEVEGGFSAKEAEVRFAAAGVEQREILETALAFEAQALDLYLRAAPRAAGQEAEQALRALAGEEQKHLAAVGRMLTRAGD